MATFLQLTDTLWRQRRISTPTKMVIYRELVSQMLLYGAHSWALTASQLEQLEVLQRHHLRQIQGMRPAGTMKGAHDRSTAA